MEDTPANSDYIVHSMNCPDCGDENANVISHQLDIPHYDDFMMIAINCSKCGFRASDFFHTKPKDHSIYKYTVSNMKDFTTKIVRASEGYVSIPELGVTIEPVTGSNTWIRNIEGVLDDIKSKMLFALRESDEENRESTAERIALLDKMLRYEIPFTVIVEDKNGNSIIIPAEQEKLEIKIVKETNSMD